MWYTGEPHCIEKKIKTIKNLNYVLTISVINCTTSPSVIFFEVNIPLHMLISQIII